MDEPRPEKPDVTVAPLRWAGIPALTLGTVLLIELLRAWMPALITVFGDAASTPPEKLGGFAAAWFVGAVLAVPLARLIRAYWLAQLAGIGMVGCWLALPDRGWPMLWVACAGVTCAVVWLIASAMTAGSARRAAIGVTAGIAGAVALHAVLGTDALPWRDGVAGPIVRGIIVALFVLANAFATAWAERTGARGPVWMLAGPALFLAGVVSGVPGRASAAGWPDWLAATTVAAAALLAIPLAVAPRLTRTPWVPAVALVVGSAVAVLPRQPVDGIAGAPPAWTVAGQVLTALALGAAIGWVGAVADVDQGADRPGRRGLATWFGLLGFVALTFAFYASYSVDLVLPNSAFVLVAALWIAVTAVRAGRTGGAFHGGGPRLLRAATVLAAVGCLVVAAVQLVTIERPRTDRAADWPVTVVAYNIRMGHGMDGRFDPDGAADAIRSRRPDIVLLSEVDRGWFVNGGHDDLRLLAERLGMRAIFAPAADQVWGDAVLTNLPVVSATSRLLPRAGAPIGAQALSVVVKVGGGELGVLATHLQPAPDRQPTEQVAALTTAVDELRDGGRRPVVLGGDLNIQPDSAPFRRLLAAGLTDGFAADRPVYTSPADDPRSQIDHLLVTADLRTSGVTTVDTLASDHLPVAATLRRSA